MDGWDLALAAVAGYVAVTTLVRMMLAQRSVVAGRLRAELEAERGRQKQTDSTRAKQPPSGQQPNGRSAA